MREHKISELEEKVETLEFQMESSQILEGVEAIGINFSRWSGIDVETSTKPELAQQHRSHSQFQIDHHTLQRSACRISQTDDFQTRISDGNNLLLAAAPASGSHMQFHRFPRLVLHLKENIEGHLAGYHTPNKPLVAGNSAQVSPPTEQLFRSDGH